MPCEALEPSNLAPWKGIRIKLPGDPAVSPPVSPPAKSRSQQPSDFGPVGDSAGLKALLDADSSDASAARLGPGAVRVPQRSGKGGGALRRCILAA